MPASTHKWAARTKCLGSSEDSLLQQLSSRISVVSSGSSSSKYGAYTNNINKHRIYNGNVKMTSTTQKEMNILLGNATISDMGVDHKKSTTMDSLTPLNVGDPPKFEFMQLEVGGPTKRPLQCLPKQLNNNSRKKATTSILDNKAI
ncbi:uncharacterized protein [Anabrus simplex]|uniref:uncharacterized protein n=1 Tax=Anabrus simplex TaxID=316456 RepID=UPI0034DCDD09